MKTYLSSKGLRPDRDNSALLNKVFEAAKPKTTLVFPDGTFTLKSTVHITKPLHLDGAEDTTLEIDFADGFAVLISAVGTTTLINSLNLKNVQGGGLGVRSRTLVNNCVIEGIPGHTKGNGIDIYGNVNNKTEASFCRFTDTVIQFTRHGFYIQGPDANESGFIHCDVRDCSEVGFYDNSFLGNRFFNCMAHYNKGGNFRAENPNNMASFVGCYSERGAAKPDYLGGHSTWHGGRASNGFEFAQEGSAYMSGKILMKGVEFNSWKCKQ